MRAIPGQGCTQGQPDEGEREIVLTRILKLTTTNTMKNIKKILFIPAALFMLLAFTQCREEVRPTAPTTSIDSIKGLRIVYVNIDSLVLRYNFAIDINTDLIRKEQNITTRLEKEKRQIESLKASLVTTISPQEFLRRQISIQEKETELAKLRNRLYADLKKNDDMKNRELRDSINNFIKEYNKKKGYDYILTKIDDNMLFANKSLDITEEVINELNNRYKPQK